MKTFTPSKIKEQIDELRKDCMVMRFTSADIADALEYLLQFVEWKTTETAPKEGTEILLFGSCVPSTGQGKYAADHNVGWWHRDHWVTRDGCDCQATHYRELPPPPSTEKKGDAA
jgi:hypothetical protein